MRRIMGASVREGIVRCMGSQDQQSALTLHAKGFLARVPHDGFGGQRYTLTDLGRDALTVLRERGFIDDSHQ